MKISTQTIKFINEHYGSAGDPAPDGVEALVEKIGAQLAAVEETIDFGKQFEEVVIVTVVSCEDHPNADRLHVCRVEDGGVVQEVERDENGLVQVVCGAPNVRAGMLAAWLPPGSTVPNTLGKDPFVLGARELRGVKSNGMLASAKELGLGDNHEGILDIDEEAGPITPGTMFADAFHLRGDYIIDMENKMFTHRPDLFGYLGLARELEGIQHRPYKSPQWYTMHPEFPDVEAEALPLEVKNELPELVPRFTAITLRDVEIKQSPVWLQVDLARAGIKSINNIVDYTNFFMLETGQPLHAYDYDKVKALSEGGAAIIEVRHPRQGEKITLLNGKEIEPREQAIMIATNQKLIGVGGVMGGAETEVDENTKHVILECATFDMYSIRRTAMYHGLFTEAVTRFNKGQSPLQNLAVLAKVVSEIRTFAGGKVASHLIDDNHLPEAVMQRGNLHAPVMLSRQFVNERLGWDLSTQDMTELLTNVEMKVETNEDELTITAPFWRTDIEIPEDIVEEIGRLNGFDKLPLDLPLRAITPPERNALLDTKSALRKRLAAYGANEVLTYGFVHGDLLDTAGQSREQAFRLSNALSPSLQYLRLSLTPSLLELVHPNIKAGYPQFALFELGEAHNKVERDEGNLPREIESLSFVFAAGEKAGGDYAGAPYYQARKYLMYLLRDYPAVLRGLHYQPLHNADVVSTPWLLHASAPFEPQRSAVLLDTNGRALGVIGEYNARVRKALKLPAFAAGFELDVTCLVQSEPGSKYTVQSRFPSIEQDICFKLPANISYAELFQFVGDARYDLAPQGATANLAPVDIYQRPEQSDLKQITLRLTFMSFERTLTDEEVNKALDAIAAAVQNKFGAERV